MNTPNNQQGQLQNLLTWIEKNTSIYDKTANAIIEQIVGLQQAPPTPEVISPKTATTCLAEYGINIMELNDDFNSNLLAAMEEYKNQFI